MKTTSRHFGGESQGSLNPEPIALDGTQAIRRAVSILKVVAASHQPGVTLGVIADAIQLSRSTTHRILKCLATEGLLEIDAKRRYSMGRLTYELSLSSLMHYHSTTKYNELVALVARRTGHTTYLMAQSGGDAVCLQKAEGTARMRVAPVDVGQRRPLGIGAGAIALLSAFDRVEIESYLRAIGPELRAFKNITAEMILQDTLAAKEMGYAFSEGRVFSEVTGVGVLLPQGSGARLAISIALPTASIQSSEISGIAWGIKEEISRVTS
jgi:DNA-binding IclR family transcriptional regulator